MSGWQALRLAGHSGKPYRTTCVRKQFCVLSTGCCCEINCLSSDTSHFYGNCTSVCWRHIFFSMHTIGSDSWECLAVSWICAFWIQFSCTSWNSCTVWSIGCSLWLWSSLNQLCHIPSSSRLHKLDHLWEVWLHWWTQVVFVTATCLYHFELHVCPVPLRFHSLDCRMTWFHLKLNWWRIWEWRWELWCLGIYGWCNECLGAVSRLSLAKVWETTAWHASHWNRKAMKLYSLG